MAKVLVVGGAGYVGSATVALLLEQGHQVWILDDLSTGHSELALSPFFICGKVGDAPLLRALFNAHTFDCVFHFAAKSIVGESVQKRDEYFQNNVTQTQVLLDEMLKSKQVTPRFIFSSTCAIFGNVSEPLHESLPPQPLNPYGETKLAVENLLKGKYAAAGMQSVALRYFNASGAEPLTRVGEWHVPETHLIPKMLQDASDGNTLSIFGDDYPTPDGTCVRDYIHVTDLASAHIAAMNRLLSLPAERGTFLDYNLGSEKGYSVKEVIAAAEKVLGKKIKTQIQPRRAGDAVSLVANSSKAKSELAFSPRFSIEEIIATAWVWENKRKQIKPRKAVFLDRDETLNRDPGYIHHPDLFELYPWAEKQIKKLKDNGFAVFVVSNQSGVGRGLIEWEQLHAINLKMNALLFEDTGLQLDGIANCPHRPDEGCDCRKPKPGLLLTLAKKYNLDLSRSYMVGDRDSDYEVGVNAGCKKSFKIKSGDQAALTQAIEQILEIEAK